MRKRFYQWYSPAKRKWLIVTELELARIERTEKLFLECKQIVESGHSVEIRGQLLDGIYSVGYRLSPNCSLHDNW